MRSTSAARRAQRTIATAPTAAWRVGTLGIAVAVSGALSLPGCYWSPTEQERLEDAVVVSARDPAANLGAYRSFFLRPEIRVLEEDSGRPSPEMDVIPAPVATPLLNATQSNLLERGYAAATAADEADWAVDLVYVRGIESEYYCANWGDWEYWGFPGWSYYFPFPCGTSEWHSGMLVTHIVDLAAARAEQAARPDEPGIMRGVWLSGVYGAEVESISFVTARAVEGIDEAFAQSPYLVRTPGVEPPPEAQSP